MTINRLPDYLGHMRQAIADALSFTEGMAQPDFEQNNRNRIAHGYFDIDLAVVWDTLQTALPQLKDQLEQIQAK
jgi:uncharacterized protein with HEPN domain